MAAGTTQVPPGAAEEPSLSTGWATRALLYPLFGALLAATQFTGLAWIIGATLPGYPSPLVVVLAALLALEGIATTRWLDAGERRALSRFGYRMAEFIVIAVCVVSFHALLRLFSSTMPVDQAMLLAEPGLHGTQTAVTLVLVALTWLRATGLDRLLTHLSISPHEATAYRTYRSREQRDQHLPRRAQSRASLARELTGSWILGGLFVVVCAAITSLQLSDLTHTVNPLDFARLGLPVGVSVGAFIYFVLGLWLISSARQQAMNEWWMVSDAHKELDVDRGCSRGVAVAIAGIALLASLLPSGDIIPFISWARSIGVWLSRVIDSVIGFLLGLFSGLGSDGPSKSFDPALPADIANTPLLPQSLPPKVDPTSFDLSPMLPVLGGIVLAIAIVFFVRGRFQVPWATLTRLFNMLKTWLTSLRRNDDLMDDSSLLSTEIGTSTRHEQTRKQRRERMERSHDAALRNKILGTYLELIKRADKHGKARQPGQTPIEYEPELGNLWPEGRDDVQDLTASFNKARYTATTLTTHDLDMAKQALRRLKRSRTATVEI